jgi:hypothetical protein
MMKKPGTPTFDTPADSPPDLPADDRVLTIRVAQPLYDAIVSEAKAAKHSINSCATILLENALEARGAWEPPKEAAFPFWKRPTKQPAKGKPK